MHYYAKTGCSCPLIAWLIVDSIVDKTLDQWVIFDICSSRVEVRSYTKFGTSSELFSKTLLQVTARKTCDENHMMFASSETHNNLILYLCPESNQSQHEWAMGPHLDHILELAHFKNSYDSDYTKCWEICLLYFLA